MANKIKGWNEAKCRFHPIIKEIQLKKYINYKNYFIEITKDEISIEV